MISKHATDGRSEKPNIPTNLIILYAT